MLDRTETYKQKSPLFKEPQSPLSQTKSYHLKGSHINAMSHSCIVLQQGSSESYGSSNISDQFFTSDSK